MSRSKEALARRAKKRGTSLEEQMKRDRVVSNSKAKKQVKEPTVNNSRKSIHGKSDNKIQIAPIEWTCSKCNNKNFARRSECNRCGVAKPQEIENDGEGKIDDTKHVRLVKLKEKLKKKEEKGAPEEELNRIRRKIEELKPSQGKKRKGSDGDKNDATYVEPQMGRSNSNSKGNEQKWAPQASKEQIERGAQLRAMSEEELCTLSKEEQERARILKERSERKRAKKQRRLEFKLH